MILVNIRWSLLQPFESWLRVVVSMPLQLGVGSLSRQAFLLLAWFDRVNVKVTLKRVVIVTLLVV